MTSARSGGSAYFLRSERLGFRSWTSSDIEFAHRLWGDAEVTRLIGGPFTSDQIDQRLSSEIAIGARHGVQYWPIFLLASGELAGCCGLRPYHLDEGIYEIGVHLLPEYQGKGYAHEAARAVIDHAFRVLCATALFAGHHPDNAASKRLLEALGFRCIGDEYYAPTGLRHPSYLLSAAWGDRPEPA